MANESLRRLFSKRSMGNSEVQLIAHLMRRAGFGATRDQLDAYAAKGYEETVEELLNPTEERRLGDDMIRRFHPELSSMMNTTAPGETWLYRLAITSTSLQEKMTLCDAEGEFYGNFGYFGEGDGQLKWPAGAATDSRCPLATFEEAGVYRAFAPSPPLPPS